MYKEQIVKDGQKILKIIDSCVTLEQVEMAEKIIDRYVAKWFKMDDVVPVRYLCKKLEAKYDMLLKIFSDKDDGTEHF